MLPDITLRIDNLVKAMEAIVMPAVDPENDLAKEQAQLVIGHLKLLNTQWDLAYLYEKEALVDTKSLAVDLLSVSAGGPETQSAKQKLESAIDLVPETLPHTSKAISLYTVALGNAIDALIYACHDDGTGRFRQHLGKLIIAAGEKQVMRERVWFQATGLDPESRSLPSIETLLNG